MWFFGGNPRQIVAKVKLIVRYMLSRFCDQPAMAAPGPAEAAVNQSSQRFPPALSGVQCSGASRASRRMPPVTDGVAEQRTDPPRHPDCVAIAVEFGHDFARFCRTARLAGMFDHAALRFGVLSSVVIATAQLACAASVAPEPDPAWQIGVPVAATGFVWREDAPVVRALGHLPGGPARTAAYGSNAAGQIVGESAVAGGSHAVLWRNGADMTDLGDLPGGAVAAVARAIDATGENVVGRGRTEAGDRAFLWTEETGMVDLNDRIAPGSGLVLREALAVDAAGRVAGRAEGEEGRDRAFLWDPHAGLVDLSGTEQAAERFAEILALGPDGAAVGRAVREGRDRPVLWLPEAGLLDLGDLPGGAESGVAHGIDATGRVVGRSATALGEHAFLWDARYGMRDLNDLVPGAGDRVLLGALGIDAAGRIVAYGRTGGSIRFFLLRPTASATVTPAAFRTGPPSEAFTVTDLGEFVLSLDGPPVLSIDPAGGVVGRCDAGAGACPDLTGGAARTALGELRALLPESYPGEARSSGLSAGTGRAEMGADLRSTGTAPQPRRTARRTTPSLFGNRSSGSFASGSGGGGQDGFSGRAAPPPLAPVPLPPAGPALVVALGGLGWLRLRRVRDT